MAGVPSFALTNTTTGRGRKSRPNCLAGRSAGFSQPVYRALVLDGQNGRAPNGGSLRNATHMVRDTFPDDRLGNLLVGKVWVLRDCGRADRGQGETGFASRSGHPPPNKLTAL